jgi:hypothetical protein
MSQRLSGHTNPDAASKLFHTSVSPYWLPGGYNDRGARHRTCSAHQDTNGFRYDVTLKTEKLQDVGLVMATSHHTILYANEKSLVVPTAEVLKLQARPTSPMKIECAVAEAC